MRIKCTIPNYDGSTVTLSSGFQLAVFQGQELSGIQTELRHGTQQGKELKDVWYAGIFAFDGYAEAWKLESASAGYTTKKDTLTALKSNDGIALKFDPAIWLHHRRKQDEVQVIRAFG